jgi:hypothetical protein
MDFWEIGDSHSSENMSSWLGPFFGTDRPMKKHFTLKFPWNIERIMAEFDAEAYITFKYVMTPR